MTRTGRWRLPLTVVLLSVTTLGGSAYAAKVPSGSGRAVTGSASNATAAYCERVKDFGIPWTTSLRGDVDGDGVADAVSSRAVWLAGGGCRAWLVVDTAGARFRTAIDPFASTMLKPPGLAGLIALRPGHRLDIAVVVELGASTGFLDVYGLAGDRLLRLTRSPFGYAGSAVNRVGVDCTAKKEARLVTSSATWVDAERRYHVERSFYAVRGGLLIELPRLREQHLATMRQLTRYPELAKLVPFPSCTAVAGNS